MRKYFRLVPKRVLSDIPDYFAEGLSFGITNETSLREFVKKSFASTLIMKDKDLIMKDKDLIMKDKALIMKDEVLEAKDGFIKLQAEFLKKTQTELAQSQISSSKYHSVLMNRHILEYMLEQSEPTLSSTEASKRIVNLSILANGKIKPDWLARLKELEGDGVDSSSVRLDLQDIYHELSKQIHHPNLVGKGLYIAGSFPMRAALGLVILALQQKDQDQPSIDVTYCDENFIPKFVLRRGNLDPIESKTPPSA